MKRKSFLRILLDGFASIGGGMATIVSFGSYHPRHRAYEERFGTDAECLASDWQKVGDDLRNAIKRLEDEKKV